MCLYCVCFGLLCGRRYSLFHIISENENEHKQDRMANVLLCKVVQILLCVAMNGITIIGILTDYFQACLCQVSCFFLYGSAREVVLCASRMFTSVYSMYVLCRTCILLLSTVVIRGMYVCWMCFL